MYNFRKNSGENITANIIWQYVSLVKKPTYSGVDNVLMFNVPYMVEGIKKVSEMVAQINGTKIRIDCKYLSKDSNFGGMIALDVMMMESSNEDMILFVLDGEGFEDNKTVDYIIKKTKNSKINFVFLSDLDQYIQNIFNIEPNWRKRAKLLRESIEY